MRSLSLAKNAKRKSKPSEEHYVLVRALSDVMHLTSTLGSGMLCLIDEIDDEELRQVRRTVHKWRDTLFKLCGTD